MKIRYFKGQGYFNPHQMEYRLFPNIVIINAPETSSGPTVFYLGLEWMFFAVGIGFYK